MKTTIKSLSSEAMLHFIWRTLRFEVSSLFTRKGLPVQVIRPGTWNHNQGPDFLQGKVRIEGTLWNGHIELHIHSHEWYQHKHHLDSQYNNVVLHVVWIPGTKPIYREDGTEVPELVLHQHVASGLVDSFERLHVSEAEIPCAPQFGQVEPFHTTNTIESLAIERIAQKATTIQSHLKSNVQDWDQVVFEEMAAMMGGPVNKEAFREMASRIPFRILSASRSQILHIEALLLGMAGFLEESYPQDPYFQKLTNTWVLLKEKYRLIGPISISVKFLRMRPASFPTVRLAQLAQLISTYPTLAKLLQPEGFPDFLAEAMTPSPYWKTHYRPGHPTAPKSKPLGRSQKEILLINALLPLAFLYNRAHGREDLGALVEASLSSLKAEDNRHTRVFGRLGFAPENALQSQGMVQLKKQYCDAKRCLECRIGYQILNGGI